MPGTETEMLWHVKGEFSQSPPMWKQIRTSGRRPRERLSLPAAYWPWRPRPSGVRTHPLVNTDTLSRHWCGAGTVGRYRPTPCGAWTASCLAALQ